MTEVLAIEDNPDILSYYKQVLSDNGYKFRGAETAIAGLEMIKESWPDLLLLDLALPDLNGIEFLERIHKMNSSLPVVVVTAYPGLEVRQSCEDYEVKGFLLKPVDPDLLLRAISQALARPNHYSGFSH